MPDRKNLASQPATSAPQESDCSRPGSGPMADRIPNITVYTHENRRALFYDDLLRGKLVMINFMSIETDVLCSGRDSMPAAHDDDRINRSPTDGLGCAARRDIPPAEFHPPAPNSDASSVSQACSSQRVMLSSSPIQRR